MEYTPDQIEKLKSLGINVQTESRPVKGDVPTPVGTEGLNLKKSSVFPLLSISGITLLSFSGLILLKYLNNDSAFKNPTKNIT